MTGGDLAEKVKVLLVSLEIGWRLAEAQGQVRAIEFVEMIDGRRGCKVVTQVAVLFRVIFLSRTEQLRLDGLCDRATKASRERITSTTVADEERESL